MLVLQVAQDNLTGVKEITKQFLTSILSMKTHLGQDKSHAVYMA